MDMASASITQTVTLSQAALKGNNNEVTIMNSDFHSYIFVRN